MTTTLTLNNGDRIPIVGLGTFNAAKGVVAKAVADAIDVGYRHFDCALLYHNEEEVGQGLKAKLDDDTVKRQELFVVTKLWNNCHAKNLVVPALRKQLENLQLDYVDLYLMHWPFGFKEDVQSWPVNQGPEVYSDVDYLETWKGMEECVDLGLARNIGVSNFNSEQITRLLNSSRIRPSANQIEVNPNINNKKLIEFCKERDIVVTGYCPLGRLDRANDPSLPTPTLFDRRVIAIAEKHRRTPAQVILKYLVGLGITIVPKTVTKERMIENLKIFDFELDEDDIAYMDSLNKNIRICLFSEFADHKYYPFNLEF